MILVLQSQSVGQVAKNLVMESPLDYSNVIVVQGSKMVAEMKAVFESVIIKPRGFFILDCNNSTEGSMLRIQTTLGNQRLVSNEWYINHDTGFFEDFDMQGLQLKVHTLSWKPWLELKGCEETSPFLCEDATGAVPEAFELLANMFNFTCQYIREPSGDWGIETKSGNWGDGNATFKGDLSVIYLESISISSCWNNNFIVFVR